MDSPKSLSARALQIAQDRGIARARDFRAAGIPLIYLRRLQEQGKLVQLSRGLYQLPELVGSESEHTLAEASRAVPKGVVCLLSALRYHEVTTQLPQAVWLAIPHKARTPKAAGIPLTVVRVTGMAFTTGIENALIEGVRVPIYSIAKTVADCFKFRRRVGIDIAIEALRDTIQQKKATPAEVLNCAKIDRVAHLVRPYLETMA